MKCECGGEYIQITWHSMDVACNKCFRMPTRKELFDRIAELEAFKAKVLSEETKKEIKGIIQRSDIDQYDPPRDIMQLLSSKGA